MNHVKFSIFLRIPADIKNRCKFSGLLFLSKVLERAAAEKKIKTLCVLRVLNSFGYMLS